MQAIVLAGSSTLGSKGTHPDVAKQIIHKLVDDLDGGDAVETVKFALDGVQYEIDLSSDNATKLRDVFAPYVAHGTKVGRGGVVVGGRAARGHGTASADREQNKAIRTWAKKAGKDISDRGRIPQEIVDEYHAKAGR
ncbi:Lsr2 family protein [Micromonospora phaseoli]|nr:Lsr2 family protein [Micromonospora phaseoli]